MSETTVCNVRVVISSFAKPFLGVEDTRKALALALDSFILGEDNKAKAIEWILSNVLEAKVLPYEAE